MPQQQRWSQKNHTTAIGAGTSSTNNRTTAALCRRALFGDVDLHHVAKWARYNYLLGFDHVFIWYLPPVVNYTGFTELNSLPYVTLQVTQAGTADAHWKSVPEEHGNQRQLILQCLNNDAAAYDWVLFGDCDEFLWFNERIGLQEFLRQQHNMTYLSFGKFEYSRKDVVAEDNVEDSGFGLDKYAWTAGSYCKPPNWKKQPAEIGSPYCPANRGRSKVMLRPSIYNWTDIHGSTKRPASNKGQVHFHTDRAHLKEWVHLFNTYETTERPPYTDFVVSNQREVSVHHLKSSFAANANGTYTMHYDDQLSTWFQFVANRSQDREG
jgi:hypothetical protein